MTRSRYENNHNFQVYGHQKFKTGAIRSYGNVIAYASEFGGHWKTPGTIEDEPNVMFDNEVFFVDHAHYHGTKSGWTGKRAYGNALVGAGITLDNLTLAQWQALDPAVNDVGSTYKDVAIHTQAAEIIAAARKLLSLPADA
jgi:putative alpha-1,2-mannosidase|eukprot:COSAG01_NODE_1866_length_9033_cov_5.018359_6_plen_141_part_00